MEEKENILKIIHENYPVNMYHEDLAFIDSPADKHFRAMRQKAKDEQDVWYGFLQDLRDTLQPIGVVNTLTIDFDACYKCRAYIISPRDARHAVSLVPMVSYISPYYFIYASYEDSENKMAVRVDYEVPAEYASHYQKMEEKINKWFPGHKSLSPRLGQEIVPLVAAGIQFIGESSIINCLFTEDIR